MFTGKVGKRGLLSEIGEANVSDTIPELIPMMVLSATTFRMGWGGYISVHGL